jgi:hypothetical protein
MARAKRDLMLVDRDWKAFRVGGMDVSVRRVSEDRGRLRMESEVGQFSAEVFLNAKIFGKDNVDSSQKLD